MAANRCVTWSPSVTLVPTRGCFNACDYCSFRRSLEPDEAASGVLRDGLDMAAASRTLADNPVAREVLLLSGELPQGSAGRGPWMARLVELSRLALAAGRLPHTNAGPLALHEMAALGRLNPSMGLMLEGVGPAVEAHHRHAPSKTLATRLEQLQQAGRLGIPFTTGLLLGLGETPADRQEALELIALLHATWGHIQEVILQPFRPAGAEALPLTSGEQLEMLATIALARSILPPEVHLQLPPNLWPLETLPQALDAGIDDLGGIDSVDVINPAYPQPRPAGLRQHLERAGWTLQPRLCIHQGWIPSLSRPLREKVQALAHKLKSGC